MNKPTGKATKKVIGQEVFYEHIGAVAVPSPRPRPSRYVVDLRELSDRVSPRVEPRPRPVPSPVQAAAPVQTAAPVQAAAAIPTVTTPAAATPAAPKPRPAYRRAAPHAARAAILLLGAAFFLSLGISLPERLIGIYFIATLVYAIDSQRTFLIALIFLVLVAVWSAFGSSGSAEQFAIYAFYFLVIGLISAIREMMFARPQAGEMPKTES
jgi:hypothetical protein